jgi:ACS family hexuronate transporter-like MFS transporter
MLLAVALWSAASGAHAWASGLVGFAVARALLGLGEGATFPGGLRTALSTLPETRRSRGIAVAYSGGSLGAIVTPLVVTPVALRFGWRAAFLCTGMLGVLWLGVWLVVAEIAPALRVVPRGTDGTRAPTASLVTDAERPAARVTDLRLWGFMAAYALGAFPLAFVSYAAPLYLHQALGASQAKLGHWLFVPPLGWELGYFFWGSLTDRRRARGRASAADDGRLLSSLALLSLPLACGPLYHQFALVVATLFFAMFVAAGFVVAGLAYATRIFSTRDGALIAGLGAGSWSGMVAVLMPVVGRAFDERAYGRSFLLAALLPALGVAAWWALELVASRRATWRS